MAELGVGYISVIPETSKIAPEISKALNNSQSAADKQGQGLGSKLSAGMGKTLKVGAASAGVAAGGAIAASLTKGMGRLTAIESAEAKLRGLGNSAGDVSKIMENANEAVTGTAYGLDAAATTAAMAVASGIKPGKELEQVLKTTADTAAIAGASMDEMGTIFGSVAARGKLQGDDLMQLQSRGIPVLEMLSAQLGKTTEDVSAMVSAGEIDFATFERAMREGVGGSALEAGNTFKGALENMGAAAGRVGATALSPFFNLMRTGFDGAKTGLDGLNNALKPMAQELSGFIDSKVIPSMKNLGSSIGDALSSPQMQNAAAMVKVVFDDIVNAAQQLYPVMANVGSTLADVAGQIGGAVWNTFASALSLAASAASALAGPLEAVTGVLRDHSGLVTAAVAAWAGFKVVPSIFEKLNGVVQPHVESLRTMGQGVRDVRAYYAETGREISRFDAAVQYAGMSTSQTMQKMAQSYTQAASPLREVSAGHRELADAAKRAALETGDGWTAADRIMAQAGHSMTATVTNFAGTLKGVGAGALTGFKEAGKGVINAFGGPWAVGLAAAGTAIAVQQNAVQGTKAAHEQMAKSVRDGAEAQKDLQSALAGTTGEIGEQGLAAATRIAKGELAALIAEGSRPLGIDEKIDQATVAFDGFANKIPGFGTEATRANEQVTRSNKEMRESYQALEDSASKMGLSIEDVNSIVAKGGPEYQQLVSSLRGMGDEGNSAADKLESARAVIDESVAAARRLDPASQEAAAAIGVLADSASSGEDKLSALHTLMQSMGLAPKDAEQAMMDAAAAVDEIVQAASQAQHPVEQLGDALFGMDGKLNPANESARELHERLTGMVGDLENVAVNGADVEAAMAEMAPAIAATAQEFNISEERVRELIAAYGGVPDKLETAIALEGASEATQEIGHVWEAVEQMKNEGRTTLEIAAVGDEAKAVMDELGIKWEETADGKNMVITATDDEAIESVQHVTQLMAELGDTEVNPRVLLDTTEVQVNADQAKNIIEALDIENPSPQATLLIDQLQNNHSIAMGDLEFLRAQSPTPKADLDKALLSNGVRDSNRQLDDLNRKKTNPKITADNSQARTAIESVRGWLSSLPLVRNITIKTRREGPAGSSSAFADGAVRYAADGLLSKQPAQIASGGRWITWAEDETQGESFIPHAMSKRKRSTQILAETADIFGLGLVDPGGNMVRRDGTSVAPTSRSFMADGGVSADELMRFARGERVNGQQARRSLEGAPYVFGGANWGDCSSTQGQLALFAAGRPATNGRYMATMDEGPKLTALNFKQGLGSGARLAIGWRNGGPAGGHTSGTIHFPDGKAVNVEMGGARGNGQIGGGAAGATHPYYTTGHMHLPLNGELVAEHRDEFGKYEPLDGVASTSVDGVTFKSGKTVSWGKAQDLFDQARNYSRYGRYWDQDYEKIGRDLAGAINGQLGRIPKFDVGGRWPSGVMGRNESGRDELVLTNQQWSIQSEIARALPAAGREINNAAKQFTAAVDSAQGQVVASGRGLGGEFLGSAEIVRDAEQALLDTRANIATQAENITKAEQEVAEARKELQEAEAKGGGLSTAQRRKLEDAEANLAKARKDGNPEKIADAEKKLARAREDADAELAKSKDKNAQEVRRAQDKLNKSEDKLREARQAHTEAVQDLEAAERAAIAARYQAAADTAEGIGEAIGGSFKVISGLFDEFGRLAEVVDNMRQSISKLQMQQQTETLNRIKALSDLQVKTLDVDRARARGVVSIAQAEYELEEARKSATLIGLTSVEAMEGAMDRFYRTGIFSLDSLTAEQVENSKEVQEALWNVQIAHKQNALDMLDAAREQEIAQYKVAEATLMQVKSTELLQMHTKHLQQLTADLNGMQQGAAVGAGRGFSGIGKIFSGSGKAIGGALAAAAGFSTMGPMGALMAAPLVAAGIADIVKGSIDVKTNRPEMDEAWANMSGGTKAAVIGGSLLGAAGGIAGGAIGGADGAVIGAKVGEELVEATVGSYEYSIGSKIDAAKRRSDDDRDALEREFDLREHQLDTSALDAEIRYLQNKDRAEADLEWAKLMRESVIAPTEKLEQAFKEAAAVEAERANKNHFEQMGSLSQQNASLSQIAVNSGQQMDVTRQMLQVLSQMLESQQAVKSGVSGVGYFARV